MNLKALLPHIQTNFETVLLSTGLQAVATGKLDVKNLDVDAMATCLSTVALQLETEHPGIMEKFGWVRLDQLKDAGSQAASAAIAAQTPPSGLM